MLRFILFCLISLVFLSPSRAEELRIGNWNIANLHHKPGVKLKPWAQAREEQDFAFLANMAKELDFDIVALQEVASPQALAKIFPENDYHLLISGRHQEGIEYKDENTRDIFTAFAVKKATFPDQPDLETLDALAIRNVEIDDDGKPLDKFTRAGLVLRLDLDGTKVRVLNVHLKSGCPAAALDPVLDVIEDKETKETKLDPHRFDCRTAVAQRAILENWIEQQAQLGYPVIVLGDFNRRLNAQGDDGNNDDAYWAELNDGTPNGLTLLKGPVGANTTCWPEPSYDRFDNYIDYVVFDSVLEKFLKPQDVVNHGYDLSTDALRARYNPIPTDEATGPDAEAKMEEGRERRKATRELLSDHCPVVATLNVKQATLEAAKPKSRPKPPYKVSDRTKWMQESAEYGALARSIYAAAGKRLAEMVKDRAPSEKPWVVSMDADETILNNLPHEIESDAFDLPFIPERFRHWVEERKASAIPGAEEFFALVHALGGKVAVITNRDADQMKATAENMRNVLKMDVDPAKVCFLGRPGNRTYPFIGNDKGKRRADIEKGEAAVCWDETVLVDRDADDAAKESWNQPHDIVMYVGDNVQDFPGIDQESAAAHPERIADHLNEDWVLLPNSAYGSWRYGRDPAWARTVLSRHHRDWANLSGLTAHPKKDPHLLYAVTDKGQPQTNSDGTPSTKPDEQVQPPKLVTIDISGQWPTTSEVVPLDEKSCGTNLDLEGIALAADGSFWVVSEGARKEGRQNQLMKVAKDGSCDETAAAILPTEDRQRFESRGFEGVTTDEDGKVYIALQSALSRGEDAAAVGSADGPADCKTSGKRECQTRIYRYDPEKEGAEKWDHFLLTLSGVPQETPDPGETGEVECDVTNAQASEVGMNALLSLGAGRFAIIERDNQKCQKARIKKIRTFTLPENAGQSVIMDKTDIDLIPYFNDAAEPVAEQIEGITINADGNVFVITDADRTERTMLLKLGRADKLGLQ